jgi:hypothetical protein
MIKKLFQAVERQMGSYSARHKAFSYERFLSIKFEFFATWRIQMVIIPRMKTVDHPFQQTTAKVFEFFDGQK